MKTVVITGSARGFGYAMMEVFRKNDFNCVLCDVNEKELDNACVKLKKVDGKGDVLACKCDVTNEDDIKTLIEKVDKKFSSIDVFINNAGVNQPDDFIWNIDSKTISRLIDINLKGVIFSTKEVYKYMRKKRKGAIYFTEGFGYDGNARSKLSIYGTSKRGVDFFIDSLAEEAMVDNKNILVGHIIPGIMITNFIHKSLGDGKDINIPEKTELVYNVLGDYPETIANYIVPKVINNNKQNAKFIWLTNRRTFVRTFKGFVLGIHPDYFKD